MPGVAEALDGLHPANRQLAPKMGRVGSVGPVSIADSRYVSFTTFRRTGEAVSTPVWIAPLPDGRAGFTSAGEAGKIKRLRHTPSVRVRASDARGKVAADAPEFAGTAVVATEGPDYDAVVTALRKKYGIQFTAVHLGSGLKARFGRGNNAVVVITFDA